MNTTHLRARWCELLPTVESLAREAGAFKKAVQHLSTQEGYEALKKVEKDVERLRQVNFPLNGLLEKAAEAATDVGQWLDREWDRRAQEFSGELREYFLDREVEVAGEPPRLRIEPFELLLEPRKDQAQLLYVEEPVCKLPLSPARIFACWHKTKEQLEKDLTPPDELCERLKQAYEDQLRLQQKSSGRVRLCDVHFQMFVRRQTPQVRQDPRKKFKTYPRYQFAYDLAALVDQLADPELSIQRNGTSLVLHRASQTASKSRMGSVRIERRSGPLYLSDLELGAQAV